MINQHVQICLLVIWMKPGYYNKEKHHDNLQDFWSKQQKGFLKFVKGINDMIFPLPYYETQLAESLKYLVSKKLWIHSNMCFDIF